MKYRKIPVVIDAWPVKQLMESATGDWKSLPEVVKEYYEEGDFFFNAYSVEVRTLEGRMKAGMPDWIIKGVKGELYPCKDDIFQMTYEKEGGTDEHRL